MRKLEDALAVYAESHRNPVNERIHYVCVPIILATTLGLLWCVPIGRWLFGDAPFAPYLNLGSLGAIFCVLFYARLSARACLYMLPQLGVSIGLAAALSALGAPLAAICAGLWIIAWAGQFYGHKVEGKKPSFADDLAFLLIGPLFVLERLTSLEFAPQPR